MLTAFLVMLREGFEAALVVAILYAYVRRIRRPDLLPSLWAGVGAAAVVSLVAGIAIHVTIQSLEGVARLRAFAAISVFAVAVITWMIFWMRRHARAISGDLRRSLDHAVATTGNARWAVVIAAFAAVLREGLEAALFLIAAATESSGTEVLAGGLTGLALAGGLGWMVVVGGRHLPLRRFFTVTGLVLVVFAAGLFARTVLFLQASGDLGTLWNNVYDLTGYAWLTQSTESGKFLAAMFGWDPRPSIEQVVVWVGYAVVVGTLFLRPSRPREAGRRERQAVPAQR